MARIIATVLILLLSAALADAVDDDLDLVQRVTATGKQLPDEITAAAEEAAAALLAKGSGKETNAPAAGVETRDFSGILNKPEKVLEDMMQTSGQLMQNFQAMRESGRTNLQAQARMFDQKLHVQQAENDAIVANNRVIRERIASYERMTQEKRKRAQALSANNDELRSKLHSMADGLTVAKEFIDRSLKEQETNSPDLNVLQELDDEDAQTGAVKAHERSLDAISALGKKTISMLEVGAHRAPPSHVAETGDLIKGIASNMLEFQEEEKQGEMKLKASFVERFRAEAAQHASVLKEQTALNATLDTLVTLDKRLSAAVEHLQQESDQLQTNLRSAERFSASMGGQNQIKRARVADASYEKVRSEDTFVAKTKPVMQSTVETSLLENSKHSPSHAQDPDELDALDALGRVAAESPLERAMKALEEMDASLDNATANTTDSTNLLSDFAMEDSPADARAANTIAEIEAQERLHQAVA